MVGAGPFPSMVQKTRRDFGVWGSPGWEHRHAEARWAVPFCASSSAGIAVGC